MTDIYACITSCSYQEPFILLSVVAEIYLGIACVLIDKCVGQLAGAATGAAVGSVVPGIGTVVGAAVGALAAHKLTRAQRQAYAQEFWFEVG
eukprot:COSAG01_NODE_1017_length_12107_cov_114.566372_11_plen_92_part_00